MNVRVTNFLCNCYCYEERLTDILLSFITRLTGYHSCLDYNSNNQKLFIVRGVLPQLVSRPILMIHVHRIITAYFVIHFVCKCSNGWRLPGIYPCCCKSNVERVLPKSTSQNVLMCSALLAFEIQTNSS